MSIPIYVVFKVLECMFRNFGGPLFGWVAAITC